MRAVSRLRVLLGTSTTSRLLLVRPVLARYASSLPEHIVVKFPSLSPTMSEGTLQKWNVKVGGTVAPGDSLADVETDKATMSFDSTEAGVVAKLLVADGTSNVAVNKPVLILVEDAKDVAAFTDYTPAESAPAAVAAAPAAASGKAKAQPAAAAAAPAAAPTPAAAPASATEGARVFASPLARKLAEKAQIQLSQITGSGPHGRITKADVEAFQAAPAKAPAAAATAAAASGARAPAGDFVDKPLTNMRKVIAKRLQESKQTVPHYYLTADINMDAVLALREKFNADANGEYKLSVNDFVVKASAAALRKVKECNSAWMDSFIREHHTVDICVAVSTEAGLITPIVVDADLKGLAEISKDVKELAKRAREGKLKPEEFQGGTFTISNLGMYGIKSFSAIINPPQSCILAVGGTETVVVVDGAGGYKTASMMSVTMSCDHRVVDGAVGAQWLAVFKKYLENPVSILL